MDETQLGLDVMTSFSADIDVTLSTSSCADNNVTLPSAENDLTSATSWWRPVSDDVRHHDLMDEQAIDSIMSPGTKGDDDDVDDVMFVLGARRTVLERKIWVCPKSLCPGLRGL